MFEKLNDLNTLIASAAEQQNSVAEEINCDIANISQVSDSIADSAQQAARGSEDLGNLAEELKHVISSFNV